MKPKIVISNGQPERDLSGYELIHLLSNCWGLARNFEIDIRGFAGSGVKDTRVESEKDTVGMMAAIVEKALGKKDDQKR